MKRKDENYTIIKQSTDISFETLDQLTEDLLSNTDGWNLVHDKNEIKVFTKVVFGEITSVRYQSTINQNLDVLEDFAYDRMLHHMPLWSKEFMQGSLLKSNEEYLNVKLLKTQFKTPFFMKNRSYIFNLYKIRKDNSLKVIYESVGDEAYSKTDKGFVRSKLYPTVYRFTKIDSNKVIIEHILSTDLGKDMPLWFQNSNQVVNGVVKANIRDCQQIKKAVEAIK